MILRWRTPYLFLLAVGRVVRGWLTAQPLFVPPEHAEAREQACRACPQYAEGQCRECTCFVSTKVLLRTERCPLGRWR